MLFIGGPNRPQTNQDGGCPPSLKIEKSQYPWNGLTDFDDQIWHGDAYWPSKPKGPEKNSDLKNLRWCVNL